MDNETLRKVQLAMLDILKEIKRVCDENDIKYFLDSGTLLGAVRHGGFIPWDDDIDISMHRSEYNKFLKIAPEKLKPQFFLQTWDSDPGYPYPFAKVRKIGTIYDEAMSEFTNQKHRELWVDIFPLDVYPDNKKERCENKKRIMLLRYSMWMKYNVKPWRNHSKTWERIAVRCKYIPSSIYAFMHSGDQLKELYTHYMTMYNEQSSEMYECGAGLTIYGKCATPRYCTDELTNIKFEDSVFLAPKDYNTYLKILYGDYMTLPPKEERVNHHHIIELKL